MTQYIKGSNGKFAGSIGEGKNNVPLAPDTLLKASALIDADNDTYAAGLRELNDGLNQVQEAWQKFEDAQRENLERRTEMNERHRREYEALILEQEQRRAKLEQELRLREETALTRRHDGPAETNTPETEPAAAARPWYKRLFS